jgi:hypothetical protein
VVGGLRSQERGRDVGQEIKVAACEAACFLLLLRLYLFCSLADVKSACATAALLPRLRVCACAWRGGRHTLFVYLLQRFCLWPAVDCTALG